MSYLNLYLEQIQEDEKDAALVVLTEEVEGAGVAGLAVVVGVAVL